MIYISPLLMERFSHCKYHQKKPPSYQGGMCGPVNHSKKLPRQVLETLPKTIYRIAPSDFRSAIFFLVPPRL